MCILSCGHKCWSWGREKVLTFILDWGVQSGKLTPKLAICCIVNYMDSYPPAFPPLGFVSLLHEVGLVHKYILVLLNANVTSFQIHDLYALEMWTFSHLIYIIIQKPHYLYCRSFIVIVFQGVGYTNIADCSVSFTITIEWPVLDKLMIVLCNSILPSSSKL